MMSVTDPSLVVYTPVVALSTVIWLTQVSRTRIDKTDALMIGWSLLTWASSRWSVSPEDTQIAVSTQIGTLALFLMVRSLGDRPRMLVMVAIGYMIGCLRESFVLYEAAGFSLQSGFGETRADLEGLNQNYLAYSFTASLLLVVWLWGRTRRRILHGVLVGYTVISLLAINVAGTRASLLGIIAIGLWLLVAHRVVKRNALALLGCVAAVLGWLAYAGVADSVIGGQVQRSDRDTGDLNGRLTAWPVARELIGEHRLFGIGAGAFRDMNPRGIDTHNAVLEVAVGTGLVGLVLFATTLYYALIVSTKTLPFGDRALYPGGLLVALMPIMLSGHWHQAPALWVVIALVSALHRDPSRRPSSPQEPAPGPAAETERSFGTRTRHAPVRRTRQTQLPRGASTHLRTGR